MSDGKEAQKRRTRDRVLDSAARLFREKGVAGAGIAEIMRDAGLTHGGFYAHFPDKTAFVEAAFERAMDQSRNRWTSGGDGAPAEERLLTLVRRYLSRDHRSDLAEGCPLPAFGSELGGRAAAKGDAIDGSIDASLEMLAGLFRKCGGSAAEKADDNAVALFALCIGGVLLARCVEDEGRSDRVLDACRAEAKRMAASGRSVEDVGETHDD